MLFLANWELHGCNLCTVLTQDVAEMNQRVEIEDDHWGAFEQNAMLWGWLRFVSQMCGFLECFGQCCCVPFWVLDFCVGNLPSLKSTITDDDLQNVKVEPPSFLRCPIACENRGDFHSFLQEGVTCTRLVMETFLCSSVAVDDGELQF